MAAMVAIAACNSSTKEDVEKIKNLAVQDSLKAVQANQKDSLIGTYLNDLNEIQDNLDRIKQREKIITMKPAEMNSDDKQNAVAEIKELDDWIVANDRKMYNLQRSIKSLDKKNTALENLVMHLTDEMTEKDQEIAGLQARLGNTGDSLRLVTARFNDSIGVIKKQRAEIAELNTVYYITGTIKELQDKGVIDKEGGFIGLGRVGELNPSVNNAMFTKANGVSLKGLSLHGKFRRFITTHPIKAYEIIATTNTDSLAINTPVTFWSESKYLVIATK